MSPITTHVLDTARGRPAAGVRVRLERCPPEGPPIVLGHGTTDADGRVRNALPAGAAIEAGVYRLVFDTGTYFRETGTAGFYPEVAVAFEVRDPAQHHHVPLLLSPYGFSTYRGS